MPPDPSTHGLPRDLQVALEAANGLACLVRRTLAFCDPTPEPPLPALQLTREVAVQCAASCLIEAVIKIDTDGPAILAVSDEITAANRDPFPINEWYEVQPNAHRAALTCAESLVGFVYDLMAELMPARYPCALTEGALPFRLLAADLERYHEAVADALRATNWPDWSELEGQLIVEAATTATPAGVPAAATSLPRASPATHHPTPALVGPGTRKLAAGKGGLSKDQTAILDSNMSNHPCPEVSYVPDP